MQELTSKKKMLEIFSQAVSEPQIEDLSSTGTKHDRWGLIIFNNSYSTFDEVIFGLMKATGCDAQEAAIEAWEAHTHGWAWVHFSSQEECERAGQVMEGIGVRTEVRREWESE